MCFYLDEWRDETTVTWVKSHEGDGGAKTNDHEVQNKKSDDDAEKAYAHLDSDGCKQGYCSHCNTVWGVTIGGKIVVHKAGAAILWHSQKAQYL